MKRKAMILASALLSVVMLASCGKKPEQPVVNTVTQTVEPAKQARETVTGYLTSVKDKGPGASTEYLAATASNNNAMADLYEMADSMKEGLAGIAGNEVANAVMDETMALVSDKMEYTVTDTKENPDGSVDVKAEIKVPDFSAIKMEDLDMEKAMMSIFGTTDYKEIAQKFAKRKGLGIADLAKYTDQNKLVADIFEAYKPELTQFFNGLVGTAATTVETANFTVKKQSDGTWKIAEMSN